MLSGVQGRLQCATDSTPPPGESPSGGISRSCSPRERSTSEPTGSPSTRSSDAIARWSAGRQPPPAAPPGRDMPEGISRRTPGGRAVPSAMRTGHPGVASGGARQAHTHPTMQFMILGRGDWIRTSDPLLPKQMRYQAAPRPDRGRIAEKPPGDKGLRDRSANPPDHPFRVSWEGADDDDCDGRHIAGIRLNRDRHAPVFGTMKPQDGPKGGPHEKDVRIGSGGTGGGCRGRGGTDSAQRCQGSKGWWWRFQATRSSSRG